MAAQPLLCRPRWSPDTPRDRAGVRALPSSSPVCENVATADALRRRTPCVPAAPGLKQEKPMPSFAGTAGKALVSQGDTLAAQVEGQMDRP